MKVWAKGCLTSWHHEKFIRFLKFLICLSNFLYCDFIAPSKNLGLGETADIEYASASDIVAGNLYLNGCEEGWFILRRCEGNTRTLDGI